MALSASDRRTALEVLRNAQFVYGLSRYPKKQVLDDPRDVKALRERLAAMRTAAAGLSAAQRAKLDVPWADLEAIDSGTEAVWKAAKRVTPKIISGLTPFVRDDPEAAFLIAPIKRGRKAEGAPEEPKVKEPPKERARTQTGLTGKEIAGRGSRPTRWMPTTSSPSSSAARAVRSSTGGSTAVPTRGLRTRRS